MSDDFVPCALCRNCKEPIFFSLDFHRWVHEQGRVKFCVKNFDADHNPTTEAEL